MVETPLRRSRRIQSQSDDEASVASSTRSRGSRTSNASSAATPTRRSARTRAATKGSAVKKELEAIPETIDAVDDAAVTVKTPAKSAKKKQKTPKKKDADEDVKVADQGVEGRIDSEAAATPAKSAKKKQKTPKKKGADEDVKVSDQGVDVGAIDSEAAATPAKSAKKKQKTPKKKGADEDTKVADQDADVGASDSAAAVATTPSKSAKKKTPKKDESVDVVKVADQDADVGASNSAAAVATTPSKSAKKKKKTPKKNEVYDAGKTEQAPDESIVVDASAKTPSKSSKKKKNNKGTGADGQAQEGPTVEPNEATSTKSSKKKNKRRKRSSSEAESADPTPKATGKNAAKKARIGDTEEESKKEDSSSSVQPATHKNSRKKHTENGTDVEVAADKPSQDASASRPEAELSKMSKSAVKRLRKSNPDAPELKALQKDSPKKVKSSKKKEKEGVGKSPTKKHESSPHKKQQSTKHKLQAAVSPSPKKKPSPVVSSPTKHPYRPAEKTAVEATIHRLRFLKLHPKSILSMASSPLDVSCPPAKSEQPVRLAISREGGSVELLSPQDRWVSVGNVPGVRGREVDALVWVCGKRETANGETGTDGGGPLFGSSEQSYNARLADERRHLFGCSRDGTIFELDFATKRQKGVIGSGGGGVFCLASMCSRGKCCCTRGNGDGHKSVGSCGGYFAAGCEDGTVKIYTAFGTGRGEAGSSTPQLVATLPSAGNAILSLAWVPGQSGNDDGGMGGSVIFAGVADGTIRRFDCTSSIRAGPISTGTVLAPSRGSTSVSYRWKSTLRMTVENRGLRESTKVWALEALSDGTVISGDSLGHVQIWDGMSGTMTQTFDHNESGADVLCLAISADENKIFASGIDSSVRCIQRQSSTATGVGSQNATFDPTPVRKWMNSYSQRKHSHDVKALAICHKTGQGSKLLELLVSGSVDTRICTYVANDFKGNRPKIWYNWPTVSPISASRKHRLLAVTRDDRIDLYRLHGSNMLDHSKLMNPETRDESKCLVKTISIQSPFNLTCSAISDDGQFLAASDAVSLYIFSLEIEDEDGMIDVHPTKLSLGGECKHAATALKFDDKGRLICATNKGPINVIKLSPDGPSYKASIEHAFKEHTTDWSASSHHFPIVSLDLSSDGKWLATQRFSRDKGSVQVFTLPTCDEEGRYQHWWSIPEMDAPTTCIKFLGGGEVEHSLAVGCSSNEFYLYNLGRRSLSHWSNDMGLPMLESLPKELTSRSEPVSRIVPNPKAPQQFFLGSHGYFCFVDLDRPVPERSNMFPPEHLRAKRIQLMKEDDTGMYGVPPQKKPKSSPDHGSRKKNFTMVVRYHEILFQDYVSDNEMVIVEEPWTSVLEELPDALSRRVYGT